MKAKNILLATGSSARIFPGLAADDRILTNIENLSLKDVPKSMVIIGSGAVGVEFASIYEVLGRRSDHRDAAEGRAERRRGHQQGTRASFKKRGIETYVNAQVEKVEKTKAA